jgi:hypothetical protein
MEWPLVTDSGPTMGASASRTHVQVTVESWDSPQTMEKPGWPRGVPHPKPPVPSPGPSRSPGSSGCHRGQGEAGRPLSPSPRTVTCLLQARQGRDKPEHSAGRGGTGGNSRTANGGLWAQH